MIKGFSKKDLKNGDVILRRDGSVEVLIVDLGVFLCEHGGWNDFRDVREDLTDSSFDDWDRDFDIMSVRRPLNPSQCSFNAFRNCLGTIVYERHEEPIEEEIEMTLEEICEALGKNVKIVRNK